MSNLWFGEIEEYTCEIHPVVPQVIIHHYLRKQGPASSCMGLLLGTITEGLVQICQCLPINFFQSEENKVSIRQFGEGLKLQYTLMRETHPKYSLIGIYTLSELSSRLIPIIQRIEKEFSVNNLLVYKFKPHAMGFDSQCYLLMRLRLETLAVFKPVPTKIIQGPLAVIAKKEANLHQAVKEIREYVNKAGNNLDKEIALLLGKAELESRGVELSEKIV